MINLNKVTLFISALTTISILNACASPDGAIIIPPPGNIASVTASINTPENEVAPVQRPLERDSLLNPCQREIKSLRTSQIDGIQTSQEFVIEMSGRAQGNRPETDRVLDYMTRHVEALSFMNHLRGVAAFSHPPVRDFATKNGLDLSESFGGTDLFLFSIQDNPLTNSTNFQALPKHINSDYWDSHPFVIDSLDDNGREIVTLLVWASDRDNPFRTITALGEKPKRKGHADLYYAFGRRPRGAGDQADIVWGAEKELVGVNVDGFNDCSPFIYCLCNPASTHLFFSSNRGHVDPSREQDYDIYSVKISVDYVQETIVALDRVERLPRSESPSSRESVNSRFDDRFPWVAWPMEDPENTWLYFNSDRFDDTLGIGGGKAVQSKGDHDIYRMKLDPSYKCTPRKVTYLLNVVVLDAVDPKRPVLAPVVRIKDTRDRGVGLKFNATTAFPIEVKPGCCYEIYGGSEHIGEIDCSTPGDSAIIAYCAPEVGLVSNKLLKRGELVSRTITRELDPASAIPVLGQTVLDTVNEFEYEKRGGARIDVLTQRHDTVIAITELLDGVKRVQLRGTERVVRRKRYLRAKVGDSITVNCEPKDYLKGPTVESEKTRNGRITTIGMHVSPATDTVMIYDTVYVKPAFEPKPLITLNVDLKDAYDERDTIIAPIIVLLTQDNNKRIVERDTVRHNKASFKLECNRNYLVVGGSESEGAICEEGDCIILSYYKPFRSGTNNDVITKTLPRFERGRHVPIKGPELLSELSISGGVIKTNGITEKTTFNDTVYLQPLCYEKPPCDIEFKSKNVAIPYFQTGMWEVNTKDGIRRHLKQLDSPLSGEIPPTEADRRSMGIARWVELHDSNSYWRSWGKYVHPKRQDRIDAYKIDFAPKVDANLDLMAQTVLNEWLPHYLFIDSVRRTQKRYNTKLVVECMAYSDRRPVNVGWYVGEEVHYLEGELTTDGSYQFKTDTTIIPELSNLNKTNDTLSRLRAWYGYKELKIRFDKFKSVGDTSKTLFDYFSPSEVITPESVELTSKEKFEAKVKDSRLIILAKGYYADRFRVKAKEYIKDSKTISDYYDYDPIRRVNVRVRIIEMEGSAVIPHDCCTKPKLPTLARKK